MPQHRLAIHPAPFKPSNLSIPPSPFSPLSPLTPVTPPQKRPRTNPNTSCTATQIPPTRPLKWVWTCHACRRTYPLGATRRCLDDGHHFCAGTTVVKKWRKDGSRKKTKRHAACGSEFDYVSWKRWGQWKRSSMEPGAEIKSGRVSRVANGDGVGKEKKEKVKERKKDCWVECDYPSQCRWGKRIGIHTPTPTQATFSETDTSVLLNADMSDMPTLDDCFAGSPPPRSSGCSVGALGRALEVSAKRRKSLGSTSHTSSLSSCFSAQVIPPFEEKMLDAEGTPSTPKTSELQCIDPTLLALTNTVCGFPSSVPSETSTTSATSPDATGSNATYSETTSPSAVEKITRLLTSHIGAPRLHRCIASASHDARKNRLRRYVPTLTLLDAQPRRNNQHDESDGFLLSEKVERRDESAVNVV